MSPILFVINLNKHKFAVQKNDKSMSNAAKPDNREKAMVLPLKVIQFSCKKKCCKKYKKGKRCKSCPKKD